MLAGLLVSVRSTEEAEIALKAGVRVIDIKEPSAGPLGRASTDVWAAIRELVGRAKPISVALGELSDWVNPAATIDWSSLSFRKIGLANSGFDWAKRWDSLRKLQPGPPWIATVYADWQRAMSPPPSEILDVALSVPDCVGLLIDTWDKARSSPLDASWFPLIARAKAAGRLVTLAGKLDADAIRELAPLGPDLFGVRSAVCVRGDRLNKLDPIKVEELVRLTESLKV